jgi:hypothetical protein
MTRLAFKSSTSHDFTCSSVKPCVARPMILSPAWFERNPSIWKESVPLQLGWIKVFDCLVRRAKALCCTTMALRTDHTWAKSSAQQTEWGPNPGHQRLWILYELSAWCPQSWALSWELHGEKSKLPEQTGDYDWHWQWLWMSESKRLCRHYVLACIWAKPLFDTLSKVRFLP